MRINAPYVGDLAAQMEWCYLKCNTDKECNHFNVHMVRGKPFCYLLKECKLFSTADTCVSHKKCNSGPKNCTSNTSCPKLTHVPNTLKWKCDHNVNPYEQQAYDKATCFLSCNAWLDTHSTQVVVVSKCDNGIWSNSYLLPKNVAASDVPALPNPLPQPDVIRDQTRCGCDDYDMVWNHTINYDPNTLPGTAFICTGGDQSGRSGGKPYITDDGTNYKFILKPKMTCRLFCDSYHVSTMACVNGHWTGDPEHGAWCYKHPTEEDDMGPVIKES